MDETKQQVKETAALRSARTYRRHTTTNTSAEWAPVHAAPLDGWRRVEVSVAQLGACDKESTRTTLTETGSCQSNTHKLSSGRIRAC